MAVSGRFHGLLLLSAPWLGRLVLVGFQILVLLLWRPLPPVIFALPRHWWTLKRFHEAVVLKVCLVPLAAEDFVLDCTTSKLFRLLRHLFLKNL